MKNMENKQIEVKSMGHLTCDADGCGYISPNETLSVEELETHLGEPCPMCGANLLTEADFKNVKVTYDYIDLINSFSPDQMELLNSIMNEKFKNGEEINSEVLKEVVKTHILVHFKDGQVTIEEEHG